MADGFLDAQIAHDNQLPAYLENEDAPCEECGVPFEDHCEDCLNCVCTCDDEEQD